MCSWGEKPLRFTGDLRLDLDKMGPWRHSERWSKRYQVRLILQSKVIQIIYYVMFFVICILWCSTDYKILTKWNYKDSYTLRIRQSYKWAKAKKLLFIYFYSCKLLPYCVRRNELNQTDWLFVSLSQYLFIINPFAKQIRE